MNKKKTNRTTNKSNVPKSILPYDIKAVSRTRQDIKSWNNALKLAQSEDPKNYPLQLLYNDMTQDALLFSQIQNRKQQLFTCSFSLKDNSGNVNQEQTRLLKNTVYNPITDAVLDSVYYGYSLVELFWQKNINKGNELKVITLPRTNVIPQRGLFLRDYSQDDGIWYRELPEFGTSILEFDKSHLGLLNKVIPHVLFKRFAQSCWSELCEIYGTPPRVLKTNTQDSGMLKRGEQMMRDMGSAAWFIIDNTENFEWATGVSTNGDVYANLINLCTNEISLVISGAVVGQDTKFGSNGKEMASQDLLWQLVQSDMENVQWQYNTVILPALLDLGLLKGDLYFEFDPVEDSKELFTRVQTLLQHYTIPIEFIKDKFGIEVQERKGFGMQNQEQFNFAITDKDFFD